MCRTRDGKRTDDYYYPQRLLSMVARLSCAASLIINWFAQAIARFDEFFGETEGDRRPLAPLRKLLTSGHEHRLTHLYRMCGTVLGSRRKSSKLIPSILALPREHFTRKSLLVGVPRISCDLMFQATFALHLGKKCVETKLERP